MSSDHNISNPGSYHLLVARTPDWLMARAACNREWWLRAAPGTVLFLDDNIITVGFDKGVIDLRWQ